MIFSFLIVFIEDIEVVAEMGKRLTKFLNASFCGLFRIIGIYLLFSTLKWPG